MSKVLYPSLKDKIILVTGATSGIGKGVCEVLLNQNATVIGIGRDDSKIKEEILTDNNFTFIKLDLSNINEIEKTLNNCIESVGKFDGFVSCAGKEETVPLSIYKADKIKSLYDINVFAGIEILRVLSKKKNSNNNASIVFVSSVMGELGQPGKVGYCSTKSAILGVVKSASLELAKRQIRVNAVSPGVVETPMTKSLFETLAEENIERIKEMHPLGIGKIEYVTPSILFLLSDQSKWITGQNIKIDGGYSIQ
ncbi:SDR family oxidoreductase [Tenacibaculum finnmarkense]|uniref:SDR family NAD(P)-dependent oxidoreductase n=1 Tax=Tenacibaculum TaxID=104267 RepID=UPI001E537A85|nr:MULTISPECIES: SDR family oxidoreductase [Tenacibaculum]MCD8400511.1 SDR family oxidoreductase [Tenacibaculum finnmarkense genomovar ulcerans]MCD8432706.1 SDR family oxidoreductase [Tenacibaculum finnmarkense genomovar ulcerans]MCG8236942.1 SDR family oxidoreductase [Tenacibaculum finnmarkense genomovar ulcerans]MCG8734309.1 SDR family oxidoreductase [Tenacibaculum finnmarkense]MCG8749742.1 SDR family oxidoreductase [Tenacibaculum finnmarkense]